MDKYLKILENHFKNKSLNFSIWEYYKEEDLNNIINHRLSSFNFSEYKNLLCFDMNKNILIFNEENQLIQYFDDSFIEASNLLNESLFSFSTNKIFIRDFWKDFTIRGITKEKNILNEEIISLKNYNEKTLFSGYKNGNKIFYDITKKDPIIQKLNYNDIYNLNEIKINNYNLSILSNSHSFLLFDIRYLKNPLIDYHNNNSHGIFHEFNPLNNSEVFLYEELENEYYLKLLNIKNENFYIIENNFKEIKKIRPYKNGILLLGINDNFKDDFMYYNKNERYFKEINLEEFEEWNELRNFYIRRNQNLFLINEVEVVIYN